MTQEKAKDDCSPRSSSRSSSDASRSKEKRDKSFLSKVVVRRLPPTMTEEQFLEQISPVPENDYLYFVRGDLGLGQHAFARAYINFVNQEDIFIFKEKFDGYVFLDTKGNEHPAIVEYAPFQKTPKRRTKKKDPKSGTLEQDPEYIKFLETLEQPEEVSLPPLETYIEEIEAREREMKANNGCLKVTTPLIEYLQQRKLEKLKLREQRREERKQREIEKKKLREEEKRRRRLDKERSKDSSKKEQGAKSDAAVEESESSVVKVLKNPVREQDVSGSAKEEGAVQDSKEVHPSSTKEGAGSSRPMGIPRIPRGNRKEWEKQKIPRAPKEMPGGASKAKGDGPHRSGSTPHAQETKASVEDKRSTAEVRTKMLTESKPSTADKDKDRERMRDKEKEKEDQEKQKDPRAERRIRNKDRPSIEIYRPGMRRMAKVGASPQEDEPTTGNNAPKSPHSTAASKAVPEKDSSMSIPAKEDA